MKTPEGIEVAEIDVPGALAAQVESTCGTGPDEIGAAIGSAFQKLGAYVGKHGLTMVSPPRAIYLQYGDGETTFISAFPVAPPDTECPEEEGVRVGDLPAGPSFRFTHVGPYDRLRQTYDAITEWLKGRGSLASEADWAKHTPMWEEYVTDPTATPPEQLVTYIYVPSGM